MSIFPPGANVDNGRRRPASIAKLCITLLVTCVCSLWCPGHATGQDVLPPNRGGTTLSMSFPPTWRWAAGFSGGVHGRDDSKITAYANAGFYRDILNPMTAALGILGEAYVGTRGSLAQSGGLDSGARIGLFSPVSRLAFGADYNTNDRELDFFMSVIHPFQRGGLLVGGGALRVDYLPGRGNSFSIGLRFPLGQPFLGRTRARQDHVELPDPELPPLFLIPDPTLVDALSNVGELAHWVTRLTVPFNDQWDSDSDDALARFADEMRDLKAHMGEGGITARTRSPVEDVEAYHRALDRAFSIATSGLSLAAGESTPLGKRAAARAREVILDHVLLPYNRLLGQQKDPDSTRGLGTAASGEFYEWLTRDTSLDFEQLRATTWTFAQVLDVIEEVRESSSAQWEDSRFVWLPFQLALTPDQHDEQGELNTIVERVTGQSFTHGNKRWYIENDQFAAELTRMIREAEDYHVLWIHDFRGYDADGNPDEEGFKQVVSSYLPALIDRVEAYDSVGKIPQYMIFIDQMYFQANGGRLWLELLENPLHHEIDLPDGYEAWEDSIARLQTDLRFAVANSELMQSQSLHFPDGWIENVVKVHVNVTNPPDPSFWTPGILPFFMGLPDVVMRDHRKISFYDATEEDPYKGMAIYTGMGVGEHYVGASWEDRAIMMQGPVLLSLKAAARQLLYNQGFEEAEVPWELRPKPMADDYDRVVADTLAAQGADWGADMQLHNQIGYRFKAVTVFKATLYTLMPPGSVIKAPDSIWGSHLWGSMLLGHALRGGRVLMIAPAIDNAPSAGFPQMAQAQDVLTRAVAAGEIFEEEIAALGGLLKVGLYNTRIAVGDVPGKLLAFTSNLERTPWLRELYGFRPEVLRQIEDEAAELTRNGYRRGYAEGEAIEPPKLHLKANYFATREAWDALLSRPDVGQPIRTFFGELAEQNRALEQGEYRDFRIMERELIPPTRMLLADYIGGLSPEARSRAATFFSIGSHNQNNRSMASDGEVAAVVSGWSALQGLPDFLVIVGLSEWIDDLDELERLFPSYHGIQRRLSHLIRIVV